MRVILTEKQKKNLRKKRSARKNKIKVTYTTGDPVLNIKHFNKMMGTDFNNPSTEEAKAAANKINAELGIGKAPDIGGGDIGEITEGTNDAGTDFVGESGGESMGESLGLFEAKREVRRYFIRPQHIFCANKSEVIKALIDIGDQNCSVYTLKYLGDEKDITKLTTKDIIYYYDDGILYDKNHVKVMDYDLYIKHEEERKRFNTDVDKVPETEFKQEYEDRITDKTEFEESYNPFEQDFPKINAFGESLDDQKHTCCICGEEFYGYGNNPAPLKNSGVCCDACNIKFVIPARIAEYQLKNDNIV